MPNYHYNLIQNIEISSQKHPDKIAFASDNQVLSYYQLCNQVAKIASFLIKNGLKKGDRVGIYLNRCLETATSIYGIMKAGCIYVPLDPKAPLKRIKSQIEDCQIKTVLTSPSLTLKVSKLIKIVPELEIVMGIEKKFSVATYSWEEIYNSQLSTNFPKILAEDLAYIIYTSGSTGTPKGIAHTHYSGLSYAKLSADLYQVSNEDIIANHAPIFFDISTFGYFTGPLCGATTVIITDAETIFPINLKNTIFRWKISIWYSVPLAIVQLLKMKNRTTKELSSIRWLLYGGEPFPLKSLRAWIKEFPDCMISNIYGPAEVNQCTYYNFNSLSGNSHSIPLGYVWANTDFVLLDENDQELDHGTGLLAIQSATRMQGYWNQPGMTNKSWYIKKNSTGFKEIYYRTGDLVTLADGLLYFVGRQDHQVKVRGHRVEMESIEQILLEYHCIDSVAVFDIQKNDEEKIIIAAIKSNTPEILDLSLVKKYLTERLPHYAIPQNIIIKNKFPYTSTGKIDRNILRENYTSKTNEY